MTVLCKNCKHFHDTGYMYQCTRINSSTDLVMGTQHYLSCVSERSGFGLCNLKGNFYDPKPQRPSFISKLFNLRQPPK